MKGVTRDAEPFANVKAEPTAIYYGAEITDEIYHELDAIAKTKGIKRYRMETICM